MTDNKKLSSLDLGVPGSTTRVYGIVDALTTPASKAFNWPSRDVYVKDYGAVGDDTADDTAAIQAAIDTGVLLANVYGQSKYGRVRVIFDPGKVYLCNGSIDLCYKQGIELDGGTPLSGAIIHSKAAGKVAIEIIGSHQITLRNLEIHGDQTSKPAIGIMTSRSNGTHGTSSWVITFDHVMLYGYYINAAYYAVESESNIFNECMISPADCGDALIYVASANDLSITPEHATLAGTGYGMYLIKFNNTHITSVANCRSIYLRSALNGLVMRDSYVYGNSATYPTIEIEGDGLTTLDNILFEGNPGTKIKYTYRAGASNYFFGSYRDIYWGSAIDYLIYADDNTDLRNMAFDGYAIMSPYLAAYAPVSIYSCHMCDFRGLAYYQGGIFAFTVRYNSTGCSFKLADDDTLSITNDYGNLVEDFSVGLKPKLEISSNFGSVKLGYAWNAGHLIMGACHLWLDASGNLRVNYTAAPSSDTDGTIIGP